MKRPRREPIMLSQMRPITLFFVLSGCILVTFACIHFDTVSGFLRHILTALEPVFTGFVFAYLLAPASKLLEKRLQKWFAGCISKHPRMHLLPRFLSCLLTVLLFIGSIALLITVVFSQVVDGVSSIIDRIPVYFDLVTAQLARLLSADNNLARYLNELSARFSATELGMGQLDTVDITQRILSAAAAGAAGTLYFVYDVVVGAIIAVYMLVSRERFLRQWKQLLYAVLKPKTAKWIDDTMTTVNQTFGTAVVGKLIDSVIIGMLCFTGTAIIGIPYHTLIAVVIGVTNIVPYFGPICGAIPCVLLILMESPVKALYFLIFIIALQQFDMNILDPKIVGHSIGLPAFWELFACLLGGGLFGFIGLIIGVPLFAVLYSLVRQLVAERLEERAKDGELSEEFLHESLGVTELAQESGFFDEDAADSPYIQRLVLLEDIAQQPQKKE